MVWWLFRKKREIDEQQLERLMINLKYSFNNIKKDIALIHTQIRKLDDTDSDVIKKLYSLDSTISNLELRYKSLQAPGKKLTTENNEEERILEDQSHHGDIIKSLTTTQQEIFKTIYSIQQQLDTEDISIKSLAKVYYPDKKYDDIRSTISEYLTILSTLGLVNKKRKGKETYVNLTKTGSQIINKLKIKFEEKSKKIEENGTTN